MGHVEILEGQVYHFHFPLTILDKTRMITAITSKKIKSTLTLILFQYFCPYCLVLNCRSLIVIEYSQSNFYIGLILQYILTYKVVFFVLSLRFQLLLFYFQI